MHAIVAKDSSLGTSTSRFAPQPHVFKSQEYWRPAGPWALPPINLANMDVLFLKALTLVCPITAVGRQTGATIFWLVVAGPRSPLVSGVASSPSSSMLCTFSCALSSGLAWL